MLFWIRHLLGIDQIIGNQEKIMSALDDLTTEVGNVETSVAAAIVAINAGITDATQLAALTARLKTAQGDLDAAIASHATAASS